MTAPLLELGGVTGGYGDVQILWGVDLAVAEGEIVCLIGANGAGKTTLLRRLSGLMPTGGGRIRFAGRDIGQAAAKEIVQAGLALVPEGRRLFPGMNVRDNLLMGAYHRPVARAAMQHDLDEIFALFPRLAERRRQDASTLSGGEQQMCAIARGLMARPRLLAIDEVSLGLAPQIVEELTDALRLLNQRGTTLLIVEQDVATALDLADRAFVLDQGRIVLSGSAAAIGKDRLVQESYLGTMTAE